MISRRLGHLKSTRCFSNYGDPTTATMETRGGFDRVDGEGPSRNGRGKRRRRRARDGRRDGACSSSVKAARRRRWRIAAAASASTATAQIAMGGATGVGVRATASTTARATHPLLSELRATESVHRASPRLRRGTPGTPGKVLRQGDVVGVTPWRPGGQTVVSCALSALVWTGPGSQQLLEQDLLITMGAVSPFRRTALAKTCLFGSTHARCRADGRGQRTLGRSRFFALAVGVGSP